MSLTVTPLVELRDVQVIRDGRTILDVPRLDIERGEVLAVLGANGAGKSTLSTTLAVLTRPTTGTLRFDGTPIDPRDTLAARRRLAMVFQDPLLLDMTVFENVAVGLRLRGVHASMITPRVDRWLELMGIAHLRREQARTLSGGEAQRTSLARALVLEPELLVLDEPFGSIDAPTRARLVAELSTLLADRATTTVLVTHDAREAFALADRIAILVDGRIVQIGSAASVRSAPVDAHVAALLGVEAARLVTR
jgi:tungstate transport system ATP-binding protein